MLYYIHSKPFNTMTLLLDKLDLDRFLYLLSFDTKLLKVMTREQIEELQKDYMLIHTHFTSKEGGKYTKMFRNATIGKCSSLNGVLQKKLNTM